MVKKVTSKSKRKGVSSRKKKGSDAVKVQSAAQLGILAQKLGVKKKASSHKGRKILEQRESKAVENPKRLIIMKGRKSS